MRVVSLAVVAILLYLTAGVLIFPTWWYRVIVFHDLNELAYQSFVVMLPLNVAGIAVLATGLRLYRKAFAAQAGWAVELENFFRRPWAVLISVSLLFLCGARAFFLAHGQPAWRSDNGSVSAEQTKGDERSNIALPIDLVYVNGPRLRDLYGQIQGDLKLTEQKMSEKGSGELEGEGKFGVGGARAKISGEAENSKTYASVEPNDPLRVVRVTNFLHDNNKLRTIKSVELQSPVLNEFDQSVTVLTNQRIALPRNAIEDRRRALIEENLHDWAPKEFGNSSWVLIDGSVKVSRIDKNVMLRFDYVPSLPDRVFFTCPIPASDPGVQASLATKELKTLDLKVFGKIISVDGPPAHSHYNLACYAVFR